MLTKVQNPSFLASSVGNRTQQNPRMPGGKVPQRSSDLNFLGFSRVAGEYWFIQGIQQYVHKRERLITTRRA